MTPPLATPPSAVAGPATLAVLAAPRVARFVRRHPLLAVGGAFLAGAVVFGGGSSKGRGGEARHREHRL